MPIEPTLHLESVSDEQFAEIDKVVMACAYAVHNKFGRLFDERVYENDLAARLRAEGFDVHTQVPVSLSHGGFRKTFFLDLVVNQMLYEIKVVGALVDEHDAQALNYAMLQNIRLVKLVNFGECRVRGKLLPNAVRFEERFRPIFGKSGFHVLTPQCEYLVDHLESICHDWGTHLSRQLYNEALVYYFGGEAHCVERVDLYDGDKVLGTHRVQFYSHDRAFAVTSLQRDQAAYRSHLNVLLSHTPLKSIQWINLSRACIEITTIERPSIRMAGG
ncbi:MAG: GxxExxY protein [Akkermansiaceae bacterium]|jgi:GxxExxY protein|nr:GxxExxY protein [Akkermansiaceae bacterium]